MTSVKKNEQKNRKVKLTSSTCHGNVINYITDEEE